MHRVRKIGVRPGSSRKPRANRWQNPSKIKRVEFAEQAAGFAEVENPKLAPGPQNPMKLIEPGSVVREVAKTERRRDEVGPSCLRAVDAMRRPL